MALIKTSKKGNILIEVTIAFLLVGIITASLLNFNTFSHNMLVDSKDNFIAMNALDSLMTNFEGDANQAAPQSTFKFLLFAASPNTLWRLEAMPDGKGARIIALLNQLKNWRVDFRITSGNGAVYRSSIIVLRISWDSIRSGNNRVRMTKEIFSIFTSRAW